MSEKHALLSASSSYRWLACPPSALACAGVQERASPYARQGTDAHSLCEYKVSKALGLDVKDPIGDLEYFDAEMDCCSDEYCNFVMEQYAQAKRLCPDPLIMLEEHLDFSEWVPGGFGTGDCVIVADSELHIIDYKHGLGILVESEGNPQLRCYALGAIYAYDGIYDIRTVKMSIFQPRRDNVSTAAMGKAELLKWAESILAPTAQLAINGGGAYSAGEHCQFCKIRATCGKLAEHSLEIARLDFGMHAGPDTHEGCRHSTRN